MGRIYDALVGFLREENWAFTPMEGRTALVLTANGEHGMYTCYAQAREETEQFVFYSFYAVKAPESKRITAMEYVTRANYGLTIGNFELDMSDGEVRYKTSVDVEGEPLTPGMIRLLILANLSTSDRYLPGFMLVLYGNRSAADAIREIEGG
jgi:hypothetical protein